MKLLLVVFFIFLPLPTKSHATNLDGEALLKICNNLPAHLGTDYCDGYLSGIADGSIFAIVAAIRRIYGNDISNQQAQELIQDVQGACLPEGNTAEQLKAVILRYIQNNPSRWHVHAAILSTEALQDAFPCR